MTRSHTYAPTAIATAIVATVATAAHTYGGGTTISGASPFRTPASVDNTGLPNVWADQRPTPTLNPPAMSHPTNAMNGPVNPPSVMRYPPSRLVRSAVRVPRIDNAVNTNSADSIIT